MQDHFDFRLNLSYSWPAIIIKIMLKISYKTHFKRNTRGNYLNNQMSQKIRSMCSDNIFLLCYNSTDLSIVKSLQLDIFLFRPSNQHKLQMGPQDFVWFCIFVWMKIISFILCSCLAWFHQHNSKLVLSAKWLSKVLEMELEKFFFFFTLNRDCEYCCFPSLSSVWPKIFKDKELKYIVNMFFVPKRIVKIATLVYVGKYYDSYIVVRPHESLWHWTALIDKKN